MSITLIREETHSVDDHDKEFLNCFVSFVQRPRDTDGTCFKQAVIITSHFAIPQIAFRLLFRLDESFLRPLVSGSSNESDSHHEAAKNLVMLASVEFRKWPIPSAGQMVFPFMGEAIQYSFPTTMPW